jgi:CBS domain containing-hemolysin-like protein
VTWLLLLAVVALLVLSALFVAAEFSLVAARRTQIEPLALTSARARSTLAAMEDVSVMMACAQLGITACGVLLGAAGEPAVAHLLEPVFADLGLPASAVHPVSLVVALLLVVSAHVAFGEMVPKNIALAGPERVAVALAPGLRGLATVLGPVVRGLNHFANGVVRLFGVRPSAEVASTFTREEVAALVAQSASEGLLDPEDEQLIGSALDFEVATVADVLVPDDQLVTIGPDASAADVERACARSGFSRYPVRDADGGYLGYVHVRDALGVPAPDREAPMPAASVRPLPVVPPDTPLRSALDLMRTRRVHMARVAGPAGRPSGVLMLEDVIEALVGEVVDATRRRSGGSAS